MVFGKKRNTVQEETESETHISETPCFVDLEDEEVDQQSQQSTAALENSCGNNQKITEKYPSKPFLMK